eukprot:2767380-Ditylum_brightwellii.AAC.1
MFKACACEKEFTGSVTFTEPVIFSRLQCSVCQVTSGQTPPLNGRRERGAKGCCQKHYCGGW